MTMLIGTADRSLPLSDADASLLETTTNNLEEPMTTTQQTTRPAAACPTWCDDHQRFSDDSANWHESSRPTIADVRTRLSTGTCADDGRAEVFIQDDEGVPPEAARALAERLLQLAEAAESYNSRQLVEASTTELTTPHKPTF